MTNLPLTKLTEYLRDALSGLGALYLAYLLGWADLTVTSMRISTDQAAEITDSTLANPNIPLNYGARKR